MPFLHRVLHPVRRRIEAERWVLDVIRHQSATRQLRRGVERVRMARLRRSSGSVDDALDQIVREARAS